MDIYHYTEVRNYYSIKNGDPRAYRLAPDGQVIYEAPPGLKPRRAEGRYESRLRERVAIFCLLEPRPSVWINNQVFKGMWDRLDHKELLLTLNVDLDDPDIYVADAGHIQGFLYSSTYPNLPDEYQHHSLPEAEAVYAKSKILLRDYLQKESELGYSLPEVLVEKHITMERISIAQYQPELSEILRNYKGEVRKSYIRFIGQIPELSTWLSVALREIGLDRENGLPIIK